VGAGAARVTAATARLSLCDGGRVGGVHAVTRTGARCSALFETNVRLYSVDGTGRRGVVFLSLDANRLVVIATGRTVFGLPYRWAWTS